MQHNDKRFFSARLAPGFEDNPPHDLLYEVVTPEGERVASATSELACKTLAASLNSALRGWADHVGFDAEIG